MKKQNLFVLFFEERNKLPVLEDYSTKLTTILRSITKKIPGKNSDQNKISKISIYDAWKSGQFKQALESDKKISLFILDNLQHEAITIWNFGARHQSIK